MVICGFSGIGKSTLERSNPSVVDIDSSFFSQKWEWQTGECLGRNEDFPINYIDHLEELISDNRANYFLISCHEEVRRELQNRGIPYIIVLPYHDCKNEYMKRWLSRGASAEFIKSMYLRWEIMVNSCECDPSPKIYLSEKEYLADIIPK